MVFAGSDSHFKGIGTKVPTSVFCGLFLERFYSQPITTSTGVTLTVLTLLGQGSKIQRSTLYSKAPPLHIRLSHYSQWDIQKETNEKQQQKNQKTTTHNHRIAKVRKDLQSFRTQYVYLLELLITIFLYISMEANSLFMHQDLKHQLSKIMHKAPSYHFQCAGMLIISLRQETAHNHWSPNLLLWFEEWEREGNFSFNCSDDSEQKAYWVMV